MNLNASEVKIPGKISGGGLPGLDSKYNSLVDQIDPSDSERTFARFWTNNMFQTLRNVHSGEKFESFIHLKPTTNETELLNLLQDTENTTTDSDLAPGHPRTDENPLQQRHIVLCEYVTAPAEAKHGDIPNEVISAVSTNILNEIDGRIHPKKALAKFTNIFGNKAAQQAEFREAQMLDKIIQAATHPIPKIS